MNRPPYRPTHRPPQRVSELALIAIVALAAAGGCGTSAGGGGGASGIPCVTTAQCPAGMSCQTYGYCAPSTDASTPSDAGTKAGDGGGGSGTPPADAGPAKACTTPQQCEDGDPCTADACVQGKCQNVAASGCCQVPADCDDGLACTADACTAGSCTHVLDGKHCLIDGACVASKAKGQSTCSTCLPLVNPKGWSPDVGAACDDGNACTNGDVCDAGGICKGQATAGCCKVDADCAASSPCHIASCDAKSGQCKQIAKPGCCTGDQQCPASDGVCSFFVCDPGTHTCTKKSGPDGLSCNDGDACTQYDVCSGGACKGKTDPCDDKNPCTKDSCSGGVCSNVPLPSCCSSGACCDGETGGFLPKGTKCGDAAVKTETKCVGNDVHQRQAWAGCPGNSGSCSTSSSSYHWTPWAFSYPCGTSAICQAQIGGATCQPKASGMPDLYAQSFKTGKTQYFVGETVLVSTTVRNGGKALAGPFKVEYRLSNNTSITSGDTLVASLFKAGLSAGGTTSANTSFKVPSKIPGTWYLGIRIDPLNQVNEVNEANNTTYLKIAIGSPSGKPDLYVPSFTASKTTYAPGASVNVSGYVKNLGNANAGPFKIDYRLSTNSTISSSDTLLGTATRTGLPAGASSSLAKTLKIPTSKGSGTWYLGVIVDSVKKVAESNESNNTKYYKISIGSASSKADLYPLNFKSTKTSYKAGDTVWVSGYVKNGGKVASGSFKIDYRLSTNSTISSGDTYLSSLSKTSLGPGSMSSLSRSMKIPSGKAPGTYYLGVRVDSSKAVAESNESNNIAAYKITIGTSSSGKPDLYATVLKPTKTSYKVGSTVSISCSVANGGKVSAGPFKVEHRLSTNSTITTGDYLLATVSKTGLAPGATTSCSTTVKLPTSKTASFYYLGVIVDRFKTVQESKESNNTKYYKISLYK